MLEQSRRNFLRNLGLAGTALAFHPEAAVWDFPKAVRPYDDVETFAELSGRYARSKFEWLTAELLATLACHMGDMRLESRPDVNRLNTGMYQLSCRPWLPEDFASFPLTEMRTRYVDPMAHLLATQLERVRPTYSGRFNIPDAVRTGVSIVDSRTGLNLRGIEEIDPVSGKTLYGFDVLVGAS